MERDNRYYVMLSHESIDLELAHFADLESALEFSGQLSMWCYSPDDFVGNRPCDGTYAWIMYRGVVVKF